MKKTSLWIGTVLMGMLVYINIAVIVNPYRAKLSGLHLPLPRPLRNAFLLFGVFDRYETQNKELTIWGLAKNRETGATYWKSLPAQDYFPFTRGERNSRMWASRHYANLGRDGHWEAWQQVGRKILDRYNRRYPEDSISQVAFQLSTWPRSPDGFYALKFQDKVRRRYWIIAKEQ